MTYKLNRRSFLKKGATLGAVSLIWSRFSPGLLYGKKSSEKVDISVVKGENYFDNTIKAIEQLGGMKKFVPENSKVAILPNVQRNNPGVYTKPDIVRAVIKMCKEAGAKEINCLSWLPLENWKNTGQARVLEEEGANLVLVDRQDESNFEPVPVPEGKSLSESRIMKEFFKNDVFINIPITKDHAGNKFTGTLKNMMGLNSPKNNRTFHKENWTTDINSLKHLDQCIADLNTVIKPDLCIVDATEFIITNGPFGPGELIIPQKVVAGTDRVGIDAYCCTLWDLVPDDIIMIKQAHEHGIGEMDMNKLNIKEISLT